MLNKFKFNLFALLTCLSMISIGYASWTITGTDTLTETSNPIHVDEVLNNSDYVTYDMVPFKYYKTGFVNDNGEIVDTAIITVNLTINLANFKEKFNTAQNAYLNITLSSKNSNNDSLNLFNNQENLVVTDSITKDDVTTSLDTYLTNDLGTNNIITYTLEDINSLSGEITLQITYQFKIINQEYFEGTIFNYLKENNMQFYLNVKIADKEGE